MVTKKAKKVLKVDSKSKVPALEKLLKNGKLTVVLVYADWCGHCTRFKKDIWNPMCERSAVHNRVSVRDDMVKNTSLKQANFDYLPSVMVVNEKGDLQTFKTEEGKETNAMPTPKTLNDMERVVNVPVKPLLNNNTNVENVGNVGNDSKAENNTVSKEETVPNTQGVKMNTVGSNELVNTPLTMEPLSLNERTPTPYPGETMKTYTPSPKVVANMPTDSRSGRVFNSISTPSKSNGPIQSKSLMKGGALLERLSQGFLPATVLGGLSLALRGGSRKRTLKRRTKKSKKTRRLIKG